MCVWPLKDYQAEDERRRLSVGNPASDALGHCCDTLPITSCHQWYRRQPSRKQWDTLTSAGSRFQPCEGRNTGGNPVTSLEANVTRQELGPWMHRLACMSATARNALQTEREGGNDPRLFPILNCQSLSMMPINWISSTLPQGQSIQGYVGPCDTDQSRESSWGQTEKWQPTQSNLWA